MLNEIKNNSDKIEYLLNNSASYLPDHNLVIDCVRLAKDVYSDSGAPDGWQRFAQIKTDSGYFGTAYLGPKKRGPVGLDVRDVVFAHRGTKGVLDLIADISIAQDRPFQQIYDAVNFVFQITKQIINTSQRERWYFQNSYHTGHSLGSIMSDICGSFMCYSDPSKFMHGRSITFENPGSKNIAEKSYPQLINMFPHTGDNIDGASLWGMMNNMQYNGCAFQSPINMVNSCNEHVGTVIRLVDKEHHIDQDYAKSCVTNPFSISAKWEGNLIAYVKNNTMDQHLLGPIVDYLTANRRTVMETNPVFGLQPAYKEFLNYETNKPYWDAYFSAIYVASGRQDREQFFKYGLDALKSAHDYQVSLVDDAKDDAEFVVVPSALEKRGIFAIKPKPMDVVPTPYNDEVPTPYNNKSYCRIM